MKISRSASLLALLTLTLLASWYAATLDNEPEQNLMFRSEDHTRRAAPRPPSEQKNVSPQIQNEDKKLAAGVRMPREPLPKLAASNLFAARSWQPPPAPVPVAAPAPPPRAPEFPYRYLGRLEDGGQTVVFLIQGNRELVVRQGDLLPNYRIEEINRRGMRMTYLPLNETQRMLFGSED